MHEKKKNSHPHEVIDFGDELHVPVLDPVVDHLDKVAGASLTHLSRGNIGYNNLICELSTVRA